MPSHHSALITVIDYSSVSCSPVLPFIKSITMLQEESGNTKKRDHITYILTSLHWLPVNCRKDFKLLTIVYKTAL